MHERDGGAASGWVRIEPTSVGGFCMLTAQQSLTQRAKAQLIGEAIGHDVPWIEVAPELFRQAMLAQGLPEDVPDRIIGFWSDRLSQPGPTSSTIEQILHRPALIFAT